MSEAPVRVSAPPERAVSDKPQSAERSRGGLVATVLFTVALIGALASSLWVSSDPNGSIVPDLLALLLLWWVATGWIGFVAAAVAVKRRPPAIVLLTPLLGLALWGVVSAHLPAKARWSFSEPAFEAVIRQSGPPTILPDVPATAEAELPPLKPCPDKIGLYDISYCQRFPAGYLFFDSEGANWLDDAGIAYLPNGVPLNAGTGSFESPQFTHLNGNWYAFTSSW